jgi:hypothetical protein
MQADEALALSFRDKLKQKLIKEVDLNRGRIGKFSRENLYQKPSKDVQIFF